VLKFSGFQGQAKSLPEATEKNLIIEYQLVLGFGRPFATLIQDPGRSRLDAGVYMPYPKSVVQ